MEKLRKVAVIEALVILALTLAVIYLVYVLRTNQHESYCEKNYYDSANCMLSPRVYTKIIAPGSHLILNLNPLKNDIEDYISGNHLNVSVYIENLRDGASFGINSTKSYPAASLNKLLIAIITFEKIEDGNLSLGTSLPIKDEDRDSSSGLLYLNPAKELSVNDLLYYMLHDSDNTAAWVLQEQISKDELESLNDYLNYYSNDIKSEDTPLKVTDITPKTGSTIFTSLYLSTILNESDSEFILSHLVNTSFDISKYAQLPDSVIISHKEGFHYLEDGSFYHSCGIMYLGDSRFSYCVMTQGIDEEKAPEVIGEVLNKLYNFVISNK